MTETDTHVPERPYRTFDFALAQRVAHQRALPERGGRRQQVKVIPAPDPFVGRVLFEVTEKDA